MELNKLVNILFREDLRRIDTKWGVYTMVGYSIEYKHEKLLRIDIHVPKEK